VKTLQDGKSAEVATVGCEGVIGASVFFGQTDSAAEAVVQVPGTAAQQMPVAAFVNEMERRGAFYNRIIRYNQALMNQIMQTTVCNGLHSAEQRCCRWLLMTHDRARTTEFPLTHEFVALMLGVRRPTVTLVLLSLQRQGLVKHRRGRITIVDRPGLEAASWECYGTVKDSFRTLLPELPEAFG